MRKLPVLLFFLNYYFIGFAQNPISDSLTQVLSTTKEDTSRVMLMNLLARAYIF